MLREHSANGVTYFTFSELTELGVLHVIGSRVGGVSPRPFASLNVSVSVGDEQENVHENRRRLGEILGVSPDHFVTAWMVHGNDVARVNGEHRGQRVPYHDALITDEPQVPLFMSFADCLPIILYDPEHRAVGLAHAGWRGTAAGIMENTILAMARAFSSRPEEMVVAFGPAIGVCHYEVGADVMEAFRLLGRTVPAFRPGQNGRAYLDLVETNRRQAEGMGIRHILTTGYCTACHTDLFFSHRAEGGNTGRFGVLVMLQG